MQFQKGTYLIYTSLINHQDTASASAAVKAKAQPYQPHRNVRYLLRILTKPKKNAQAKIERACTKRATQQSSASANFAQVPNQRLVLPKHPSPATAAAAIVQAVRNEVMSITPPRKNAWPCQNASQRCNDTYRVSTVSCWSVSEPGPDDDRYGK